MGTFACMSATDWTAYLRQAMLAAGYTRNSELAAVAGVGNPALSRWLKGTVPDIENCRKLAEALRVPLLEILVVAGHLTPDEAAMADRPKAPDVVVVDEIDQMIRKGGYSRSVATLLRKVREQQRVQFDLIAEAMASNPPHDETKNSAVQ